jgi:CelD/BcsL family acetyltransferase involved in cellulose biosynthesis
VVVEAWRALAVAAENPFALPDWQAAWCAAHPQDAPRTFVCRRADGEVAGVLPLVVRTRRRRRVALMPGDDAADFCAPACAPADSAAVAHAVLRELARAADLWRLERCIAGTAWAESIAAAARPAGFAMLPWRAEPPLVVADLRDRDDLVDAKQRRDIARLRRRLERDHAVVVRSSQGPEEARRDLGELLRLHADRWGPGTFPAPVRAFHADFAARAAEQGWLRLHTLEVDGRPAAVLYGWRLNTRAFAYSQAFDPAHARDAVGVSLLVSAVEQAAAEGCAHFDMLRGDEQHKQRFRISSHPLESHFVARRRSPAILEAFAASAARRAWARLPVRGRALVGRLASR